MHYIEITNFSVITKCRIEIKKINILIGPQASGKSVIAKAVSLFNDFFSDLFEKSIREKLNKTQMDKKFLKKFELIFPRYTWEGRKFEIKYRWLDYDIAIYSDGSSSNKCKVRVVYSPEISKLFLKCKKHYQKLIDADQKNSKKRAPKAYLEYKACRKTIDSCLVNTCLFDHLSIHTLFIPAARSFFANLQKNIFTFLASSIDIDPFVKEFGSIYESVKGLHSEKYSNDPSALLRKKILKIGSRIIRGEYLYEDDKDWIKSKAEKINVANASSGQQESLPMLVVLSALPYDSEFKGKFSIFIEEPEAHLFPIAQKHIVSILASIYKESSNSIFITTHSPYILSAFNVLITASDVLNKSNEKEVRKIIGEGEPVSFDDVSAYNISNGKAETIMDSETRLIGVNIIDEVSDSFNREFDNLLELGE